MSRDENDERRRTPSRDRQLLSPYGDLYGLPRRERRHERPDAWDYRRAAEAESTRRFRKRAVIMSALIGLALFMLYWILIIFVL